MGWVKTRDIPEDAPAERDLTISVNKWSGVRINVEVYTRMDNPKWVEIEYDADAKQLRLRPSDESNGVEVIANIVKVPNSVRSVMSAPKNRVGATQRYLVEYRSDGWWYTTRPSK